MEPPRYPLVAQRPRPRTGPAYQQQDDSCNNKSQGAESGFVQWVAVVGHIARRDNGPPSRATTHSLGASSNDAPRVQAGQHATTIAMRNLDDDDSDRETVATPGVGMAMRPQDLLYGTLDILVLRALASGPAHGYAVASWIRRRTAGEIDVPDTALYKALHRLEASGAVIAKWGQSPQQRPAKYYSLTAGGRRRLKHEVKTWRQFSLLITGALSSR
jgi:transcriptional regulator